MFVKKTKQRHSATGKLKAMDNRSRNSMNTGTLTGWNSYSQHSTASQREREAQQRKANAAPSKAVSNGRVLFLVALVIIAAGLAVGFYLLLFHSETKLAEKQFESIAERAIETAKEIAERKRLGTLTMAINAAAANPDIAAWPFVKVSGFEEIATSLIHTSNGRELGFAPIVAPEELQEFEDFAYQHFEAMGFPNTTATKPFGRGVFGFGADGAPYKETDGKTFYNSPNQILTPIIQHDMGIHPALLLNIHFAPSRGDIIDGIIACSEERKLDDPDRVCAGISDMLILTSQEVEPGPGAVIIQPIYPKNDPMVLGGILASTIVWNETLQNVFQSEVTGIDCVLSTETQTYTYYIENGAAVDAPEEGDMHDPAMEKYRRAINLTDTSDSGSYSHFSADYVLELYPTEEFFNTYRTDNPRYASFGAFLCIVLTMIAFLLYDFYVRKDFNDKRELLEAKRKFVRFVSHEVRTPLNSVSMGLSLLREEIGAALGIVSDDGPLTGSHKVDEKNAREWYDLAQEVMVNTRGAISVLNDLLNYDKVELKTLTLEHSVIPIWSLVETTVLEFKLPASAKNVSLDLDFDGVAESDDDDEEEGCNHNSNIGEKLTMKQRDRKVVGDNSRLTQVIRNLISNALKFNKQGGKIKVRVSWEDSSESVTTPFKLNNGKEVEYPSSGYISIAVTDTGAGMSEDQIKDLFQEGVQFNVNVLQAGQGSGLGLYISKGIVEQHGGSLVASSEGIGLGTTFTTRLPLFCVPDNNPSDSDGEEDHSEDHERPSPLGPPTRLSILVVDDSQTNRKLLRRLLENHGHSVLEAEDGKEAVQKMVHAQKEGSPYDSILMDYEMPVMNGPDACQKMRILGCDSIIVGVTGNVMEEDVEIFKECGANGVLPKPFKLSELDQLWMEHGLTS